VPLSEHEQRLLEQMEKALYAEDPKFATSLRAARGGRVGRGRAAIGVLGVLAGLGLLLVGVATAVIALGVVGFTIMLIGAVLAYSGFQSRPAQVDTEPVDEAASSDSSGYTEFTGLTPPSGPSQERPSPPPSGGGFMDRMEERWRRRQEGE
jgi:hypothetical protein